MLGRHWLFLVPKSDRELFARYERRVVRHGPGGSGERFPQYRMRFARPAGEIIHVQVASTVTYEFTERFGDSQPHMVCRLEDVTDREQIANYFRLAMDHSPVSLSLIDRSGHIVFNTGGRSPQETDDVLDAATRPISKVFADYKEAIRMVEAAFTGEAGSRLLPGVQEVLRPPHGACGTPEPRFGR
ncbi:hypothetical protein CC117_30655 [Parafrankia colletiae]|uniref:Uncharacterized protein n=2 Tax=Parafrankia colletiae TaxID=573497 RepID=A0A1S1Q7I4_9ACTN|nr:hypothetical protein CC117_30655 [Parafrankia colletiae]